MPRPSDLDGRSTAVLVEAGEILRKLNPPTLAALLFVLKDNTQTQAEMADAIGCSRSSISKYLRTLSDLPLPLATQQRGRRYTVTDEGKKIVGLIDGMVDRMTDRHGLDLRAIDWENDADREEVATDLAPLYGSRSSRTFFVLDALRDRSGSDDLSTSRRVWIENVVHDVDVRLKERDESVTTEQVRNTLRRFADNDTIEFDGEYITLIEKGRAHAWLLDRLAQSIEEENAADGSATEKPAPESSIGNSPQILTADQHETDVTQQIRPHRFYEGDQRVDASSDASASSESPIIVPAYCLKSIGDGDIKEGSRSQSQLPILSLTTMTIAELAKAVNRLTQKYDENMQIEPYWTLQMGSELYPLGPAQLSPTPDDS